MMMRRSNSQFSRIILLIATLTSVVGCESAGWDDRLQQAFSSDRAASQQEEEKHRSAYMETRDREHLYWLLANRIETGMTQAEVSAVLGQRGEPEPDGRWIRQGDFRVDDTLLKFGPDSDGMSVYLVFREGKLVNHEPSEFRTRKKN